MRQPALRHYALAGSLAVFPVNLVLRAGLKVGGLAATLIAASLIAGGLLLTFQLREGRPPDRHEQFGLLWRYTALLALGYLLLGLLMSLKDRPSPMGLLLLVLHALCYPLLLELLWQLRRRA